ncbi:nucleotidyltransferase-like protein [Brevibacillus dissolubilis]|uniref:nucleotidyltransferase-like protein n=1 Tax=Brevibacillus dissolubilis TaxID=1844116 RepID=UPI0011173536|nr:nucleotidyltransferase-like protein [Brevibacillus dissolubilis]
MNPRLHQYHQQIVNQNDVLSALLIHNPDKCSPFFHGAPLLSIIIMNRPEPKQETRALYYLGLHIVEYRLSQWQLEQWVVQGSSVPVVSWLTQADIMHDPQDYMKKMKERFLRLSQHHQKRKICETYSQLLKSYMDAKAYLHQELTLEAYHSIQKALHTWAQLVLIEANEPPEPAIWKRVKQLEPSAYKLYEELVSSPEPLAKRVELLLLPLEFHIMSKMKPCTQYLYDILLSQHRPWTLNELLNHSEIANSSIDVVLLLDKMAKRSLIQEVHIELKGELTSEKGYMIS